MCCGKIPCPDPDCVNGTIVVYNVYSDEPFVGKAQICDSCGGAGFLIVSDEGTLN